MTTRKLALLAVAAALLLLLVGCQNTAKASAGFRLPDGDPVAGQRVFSEMKCYTCHTVIGLELPAPTIDPPVPVVLGGEVSYVKTDGELVTSIINPSHKIPPLLREELVKRDGASRMPDYRDAMNVRELQDLVAFLHTRYEVVRPGPAR